MQNEIFEQLKITDDAISNVEAAVELSVEEKCVLKTTLAASNSFKSNNNLENLSLNGESFFHQNNNKNLQRNDATTVVDAADGGGCVTLYKAVKGVGAAKMYDDITTDDVTTVINRMTVENFSDSMMEMRDDWNFMTQFDNFVEFEMKNLTNRCNRNIENSLTNVRLPSNVVVVGGGGAVVTSRTTATKNDNNNNHLLLKPEKHVSL